MEREHIKKIVYKCASEQFYNKDEFYTKMSKSPNDGEDLLLYSEVGFDSLDMVEFILSIETYYRFDKNNIELPDNLFTIESTLRKIIDYIYNLKKNE